jgi:hypothetical protein
MRTPSETLLEAAGLIETVMGDLDTSQDICACCGLNKRRNWNEAQAHKELAAVVRKLKAFAGSEVILKLGQ